MSFVNIFSNESDIAIRRYFQSPFCNNEYRQAIESVLNAEILGQIDNSTFNLANLLRFRNDEETEIIKRLASTMSSQLRWVRANNTTGYFGVISNYRNGNRWSYLNLVENQYHYSEVIYARSLSELERKVKSKGHLWYVFDENLAGKTQKMDDIQKPEPSAPRIAVIHKKPERQSKFKGMSAIEEIKLKRQMQDKVLRRNSRPTSMIEKMFV